MNQLLMFWNLPKVAVKTFARVSILLSWLVWLPMSILMAATTTMITRSAKLAKLASKLLGILARQFYSAPAWRGELSGEPASQPCERCQPALRARQAAR